MQQRIADKSMPISCNRSPFSRIWLRKIHLCRCRLDGCRKNRQTACYILKKESRTEGAKGKRETVVRMSTAELQNELRRIVWDDLTAYLKQFSSGDQIIKELGRLLIAA